jgi:hypothetical protein
MEFPPSIWSIRDVGQFDTAEVRAPEALSMEVMTKV